MLVWIKTRNLIHVGLPHQWVKETEAKQIAALREEMKEFKKIAEERGVSC